MKKKKIKKVVTDYWLKYYSSILCMLCDKNSGVIVTPSGTPLWCICPNGMHHRKMEKRRFKNEKTN